MTRAVLKGKPDAVKPHVRFDEGIAVSDKPRRCASFRKMQVIGSMAVVCALFIALAAQGKTVALWPMEDGLRCMVDSRLTLMQLEKTSISATRGLAWAYPPNPDADRHLAEIPNSSAIWSTDNSGHGLASVNNAPLANALCSTSEFTIEGWINIQQIPDQGGWYILTCALGGSGGNGGWIWSVRRNRANLNYNTTFELFVTGGPGDTVIGGKSFADPGQLTNRWIHVALTHRNKNASGLSEWAMYTNGVHYGSVTHTTMNTQTPSTISLELGGRSNGNRFRGGFDYWRVSDRVLAPGEFLCAGGQGTPLPTDPSPTAYYWKLDRAADGTIDTSPQVSRLPLSGGLPAKGAASTGRFHPSADQAFDGNPPNTTVTIPGGNCGSFYAPQPANCWQINNLGAKLEVTNSFTVEGWFKPERSYRDGFENRKVEYVFNTRMLTAGGWALGLQALSENTWKLVHFVQQSDGTTLVNSVAVSDELSAWTDWKHVALSYDHMGAGGKGLWTCYLDGVKVGEAANAKVPTQTTNSQNFHICGRTGTMSTFLGRVDCVRVSKGVLNPNQFLCSATDCQAVPDGDVLAFWPLDVKRGAYICGDDLTGNYSFQPSSIWTAARMAAATADAPVITNPDRTWTFAGSPTNLNGSVAFNTPANGNASSSELSAYSAASQFFRTRPGWTAECYVKRTSGTPTAWELLFGSASDMTTSATGMKLNFTYRSNGFVLLDSVNCNFFDTAFSGTSGSDLPEGRWAHVALTFKTNVVSGVSKGVYEVFVDGVSKGTITANLANMEMSEQVLVLGGRSHSGNSFNGNISSFRLSSRTLDPSEFLCATPVEPVVEEKGTVAYWPLDFNGSTVDVGSRVTAGALFNEVNGVSGSTERAVVRVRHPDQSEDFEGNPRANVGSLKLTNPRNNLVVNGIGLREDIDRAFTVEGWFKAQADGNAGSTGVICGTYRPGNLRGWKLYLDKTGAIPCVRLMATPGYPCTRIVVDAVLLADASDWMDAWKHVALTYNVHAGTKGRWTLWVDGKVAGHAENRWAPQGSICDTDLFALGAIQDGNSALGSYDLWRVSKGALASDEFIYSAAKGHAILVR